MNRKGEKKFKNNVNKANNTTHQTNNECHRIVDDKEFVINKSFGSLSICLKPQDDFPHPRHLCFTYPFHKSSPKRHFIKCYCYVCEKIAPCKNWIKAPKRHCDATEKDDKWILEKKLNNKLPGSTTMLHHKFVVTACYPPSVGLHMPHRFGAGLISNNDGEWIIGFSMPLGRTNIVDAHDISAPFYTALLEALQFAWSRGFRCLEIKLGFMYHEGFWLDFTRDDDDVSSKFRLCVKNPYGRALATLKTVEGCLNREWFIKVKNSESYEEEHSALLLPTLLPTCQAQALDVYDFRKHLGYVQELMSRVSIMRKSYKATIGNVLGNDICEEDKKYYGLT